MKTVHHDERSLAIENASYHWGFNFLSFGLLIIAAIRGYQGEAAWDLILLVVMGGGVCIAYQAKNQILTKRSALFVVCSTIVAIIVAAMTMWFMDH